MRKVYLIIFAALLTIGSFAQSLQRHVFNSTGGHLQNGDLSMIISIGEPVTGVVENSELGLSQGYLLGSKSIVAVASGISEVPQSIGTVYPNPFTNYIQIRSDEKDIQVVVYSLMGQEVYKGTYTQGGIDLAQLPTGLYMIKASVNETNIINTKILKQ